MLATTTTEKLSEADTFCLVKLDIVELKLILRLACERHTPDSKELALCSRQHHPSWNVLPASNFQVRPVDFGDKQVDQALLLIPMFYPLDNPSAGQAKEKTDK